jgi:REP-associated tyrosine transposase
VYLNLLKGVVERHGWRLLSYCLMPDHVHLLIQTPQANLSDGMNRLRGAYARKFNQSRGAVGHVFEGRFKNRIVTTEQHLFAAFGYIALNPVRRGLCSHPEQWAPSAHSSLVGAPGAGRRILAEDALRAFDSRPREAAVKYQRYVEQLRSVLEGQMSATR